MIKRICPICGQEFTTNRSNTKYCSDRCKAEGAKLTRKKWEAKTDYKEKQRQRMQAYRSEQAEEQARLRAAEAQRLRAERAAEFKKHKTALRRQLKAKASAGDPLARMQLSNPLQLEYWQAYKDYELQYANQSGQPSTRTVNGVSIYDTHFPEEVVQAIKEAGIIIRQI